MPERLRITAEGGFALLLLIVIIGGMKFGVFTPTEAAVVAAVYSFVVGMFIYRELKWSAVYDLVLTAGKTTAVVMFLVAAAMVSAWLITVANIPTEVAKTMEPFMGNKKLLMFIMMVLVVIVGTALDFTPTVLILTPVLMPLVLKAGIDPVYFGVMFIMNNAIGLITPPDIALWDINAKAAGQPLWKLLGGQVRDTVRAYNTDIGWLSIADDKVVEGARGAVADGFTGINIKVGSSVERDLRRLRAVRQAIGPDITLAIDGNGKWDLATCQRFCRAAEESDVFWFEEPLWHDDVKGQAQLARAPSIPVALGEQLYTTDAFAEFFAQQAIAWVHPDVTRMAGLSEVLRVCETAHSFRLPVAPHAGDMSQVHVHLSYVHPACEVLEYIPWIKNCFTDPAEVVNGYFMLPQLPGAGTTPTPAAWDKFRKPVS